MNDLFQKDKDLIAIDRIQAFCPKEGYYVAFSGGKDSVVILDLVKRAGVPFDAHYNITGIDPPELYYFIRDEFPEVQRHRPEKTMWKLIEKKMIPPTQTIRYCCERLKENGGHGRRVITGIRWAESTRRKNKRRMNESCFKDTKKQYLNPIIDWSDEDIWSYIHKRPLKYCVLYDEGFKRLGCIGCPCSGSKRLRDFERWPRYKTLYLKAFNAAAEARRKRIINDPEWGLSHAPRWIGVTGEEIFNWWMAESRVKDDLDQTVMFE
jgi:phosphoadenosine phosphosulfate reductase